MLKLIVSILFSLVSLYVVGQKKLATISCKVECGGCKNKIESVLSKVNGVDSVAAIVGKTSVSVRYDGEHTSALELSETLANLGFKTAIEDVVELEPAEVVDEGRSRKLKKKEVEEEVVEEVPVSKNNEVKKKRKNGSKAKKERRRKKNK